MGVALGSMLRTEYRVVVHNVAGMAWATGAGAPDLVMRRVVKAPLVSAHAVGAVAVSS
jgi:hypothetical protein